MKERLLQLRRALVLRRPIGFLERISAHVRTLSPGDTLIAGILCAGVVITSLIATYHLAHRFQIEVPSHGGSLTEGVLGSPRFVNPLLAFTDADRDLVKLTFAGLMGYDKEGMLVPVLAESYSVSEDGKTYTFVLREHLRFSDGSPVTAADVVYTVEKAQDPSLKSPELSNWTNIRVEALDARTVQFTLPKAYAPFLMEATLGILPSHIWRDMSNEEFPFAPEMSEPVGAGPFEVGTVVRGKNGIIERYNLRAFDDYALGKPHLAKMTLIFFSREEDLVDAVKRGRVESAHSVITDDALHAPYSRIFGVFFNQNQNPLFARLEVRKALSLAIDRETLVNETLGGFATPVYGPVPFGTNEPQETGVEVARAILEKAGWEQSEESGVWEHEKEGLTLRVNIKTSNVAELKVVAEGVRANWEALGVPVSLEFYEPGDLAQNVIRPRKYDALLFGMVIGRDNDLFAFWESSQRNDPGLNIAMYANKDVDELLEEIRVETDPDVRTRDLEKVNALIAADYPAAFTHAPDFVYSLPEGVHGVVLGTIASPSERFSNAAFWYRYTEWIWPIFASAEEV